VSVSPAASTMPVRDLFGILPDGRGVDRWTFGDHTGVTAAVLTHGAVLQSLTVPDPEGRRTNVVLGFDKLGGYLERSPYFGCVVGRYANRIADGRFWLNGREYRLPVNDPGRPNTLHGGPTGFHRRVWLARPVAEDGRTGVELSLISADGDQGFPGRLKATVRYTLAHGALYIDYRAETDAPTVINLTNHSYFNLSGEGSGTVDEHVLTLAASTYLPVDERLIPRAAALPVAGSPFDFTAGAPLGARLHDPHEQLAAARGYDHCFVLHGGRTPDPRPVGTLYDPATGSMMHVLTTEPGLQVYTANDLSPDLVGTSGRRYGPHAAVALETQHFPDSPNRPDFPSPLLAPGQIYRSTTVLRFSHLT
jgi:aldose 1-epimerase